MKYWLCATMVVGAALLTGCADKKEVNGVREAEGDLRPLVAASCDWMFGCCSDGELVYELGDFTVDAQNCTDRLIEAIKTGNPVMLSEPGFSDSTAAGLLLLARSINEGRVQVRDEAVQACAAATQDRACNMPVVVDDTQERCTPGDPEPDTENPCDPEEMFIGQQDVGEECDGPFECVAGLRCIDFGIVGICAEAAAEGETCYSDAECADGLVCGWADGLCVIGAQAGESCAYADPENPIPGTEITRCDVGLSCDPASNTCTGGFCAPGSPCVDTVDSTDCPEGTFCIPDLAFNTTCRAAVQAGEPCAADEHCVTSFCDPFTQACGTKLANGQNCLDSIECESGYCDISVCAPTVGNGQPCPNFDDDQCSSGYCDTSMATPVCTAYASDGGACPFGFECDPQQDLVCVEMTCRRPPFPNGIPCFDGSQCETGVCFNGLCANGTEAGQACDPTGTTPPCVLGTFCDVPQGQLEGICEALRSSGESCERSEQCWGECIVRYGRLMCDATPAFALEEVWCDGG